MSKRELIVAIDGPSAAGKSTAGTRVAKRLGYLYIESGAFYRALAWKVREQGIDPSDNGALQRLSGTTVIEVVRRPDGARILVDQRDVTDQLRTPDMSRIAAQIASNPLVREPMLRLQRTLAKDGGVVMEGRDIGTVVFPEADVKFYLDADTRIRGERRYKELRAKGMDVELQTTIDEIVARDRKDMDRAVAPLRKADDAIAVDSTGLTLDEVVDTMVAAVERRRTAMSR
ncbi:MAG TPA: (d)CMP kinase [Nitrospiria bacterium]|nr:(d)CMP kinase [Nitrospiria bacterium]